MLRAAFLDHERHRAVAAEVPLAHADRASTSGIGQADRLTLDAALAALPVEQREVVVLHLVEGLTFREVGVATGASQWTAASRYRLGMHRLRGVLGADR